MTVFNLQYHCPDLRTMEDAEMVREVLAAAPGVGAIEIEFQTGTVNVVTANQDGPKDIENRLINAGFRPEETL